MHDKAKLVLQENDPLCCEGFAENVFTTMPVNMPDTLKLNNILSFWIPHQHLNSSVHVFVGNYRIRPSLRYKKMMRCTATNVLNSIYFMTYF